MKVAALIVAALIGLGLLGFFAALIAWAVREAGGGRAFLREVAIPLGLVAAGLAFIGLLSYAMGWTPA